MDSSLRKMSASSLSPPLEPVRPFSVDHGGLMSWPENFFKGESSDDTNRPETSLSAKALHLSLYGTMMTAMPRRPSRSFGRSSERQLHLSLSSPRVFQNVKHLLSVQSEGGRMNRTDDSSQVGRIGPLPPLPVRGRGRNMEGDDSSEDSDNEIVMRIDSPSTLSFSHAS